MRVRCVPHCNASDAMGLRKKLFLLPEETGEQKAPLYVRLGRSTHVVAPRNEHWSHYLWVDVSITFYQLMDVGHR